MSDVWEPIEHYHPVGGNLALDLANTASRSGASGFREKLDAYDDLVVWGERTGLSDEARTRALRAEAERRPEAAAAVLERARELREAIYGIFSVTAIGGAPSESDIDVLDRYLTEGAPQRRIHFDADGWGWRWESGPEPLAQFLWPTAFAAAELLVRGDLARVKECGSDTCSWLFIDLSKNRSRRWCDMDSCGNRAKARRHYRRKKLEEDG